MIKYVFRLALLFAFFWLCWASGGCRSVHKDIQKTNEQTQVETKTQEQSTTETTKKIDTLVNVPGDSLKSSVKLDSAKALDTVISSQKGTIKVKLQYDPELKRLHLEAKAEPQAIPVKMEEHTKTTTNKAEEKKEQKKTEETVKKVDREPQGIPWYVWLIIILFLLYLALRYGLFRIK